jgi:dynamin family protein
MSNSLEQQITEYQHWREQLMKTLGDYRDWLQLTQSSDSLQELRLYDMEETLRKDRLVLAFVAEFSRGKTETINALFFSDFDQRLLPCDPGRTTMCPTEIFWNSEEEPCIKLLSIETRKRDDGLAFLKTNPNEWTKIRLDMSSAPALKEAFQEIVRQKEVTLDEARILGLWDDNDVSMVQTLQSKGKVDIPVWRHALINFPHPLLKSGLVILDTPGLNTLGTEPELTLSIIPNAHAVIFLLATDTGVTKSDMQIWTQYIRNRASRKLALLNKIDILWDDMKSGAEIDAMIQTQVETTARQLNLMTSSVFAISAQKALVAKIRKDAKLLERSGIGKVEQLLAENVVGAKNDILRGTIVSETATMVKASRKIIQQRVVTARARMAEFQSLRGKNRDAVQALILEVNADRKLYDSSLATFNHADQQLAKMGEALLGHLSSEHVQTLLDQSKKEIGDSWTTIGLNRSMKGLIKKTTVLAEQVIAQSQKINYAANQQYQLFHRKHGFEERTPAALLMQSFIERMQALENITEEFCSNPVNVMTEKHFLVRKFFHSLGRQVQAIFETTYQETNKWLLDVLAPLKTQISEHEIVLKKRTESLMQVYQNADLLKKNMAAAEEESSRFNYQSTKLDQLLLVLMKAAKPVTPTEPEKPVAIAI